MLQAAEDERRRIGRILHDGAQQRLVAIGHFLDIALKKIDADPEQAASIVERARDEAREAGRELRDLARDLNPATLAEHGLEAALPALASGASMPVRIEAVPAERLPDPVEAAIYRFASEAVAGAQAAGAAELRVAVEIRGDSVVAEARHDAGVAPPVSDALADRIELLGGTLAAQTATIPLSPGSS